MEPLTFSFKIKFLVHQVFSPFWLLDFLLLCTDVYGLNNMIKHCFNVPLEFVQFMAAAPLSLLVLLTNITNPPWTAFFLRPSLNPHNLVFQ